MKNVIEEAREKVTGSGAGRTDRVTGSESGRIVVVTGATGLIGAALVRHFAAKGDRVIAAVRNPEKAQSMFASLGGVSILQWDVCEPFPGFPSAANAQAGFPPSAANAEVDFFVHAAAETASKAFVARPVETIRSILLGTEHALEFARRFGVKSMVFLSTMEVYGAPTTENVTECDYGFLDPVEVRSSYPEAKRLAENLCVAYAKEYGVPVKIARLTQTFGEGVRYDDGRVFAEFARCLLEKRDIVLKTEGTTARCYCYLGDAVSAIETILKKGEAATPYTVANEATYCTIREMAERLCRAHPESGSRVVVDTSGAESRGFAPPFRMKLDCSRLRALGWRPKVDLLEMYARLMRGMRPSTEGAVRT